MGTKINLSEFKTILKSGAEQIKANLDVLTKIDGKFGDGDHGLTMGKVADVIIAGADASSLSDYCEKLGMEMMSVNGGSASALWGTLFTGFASAGLDKEMDADGFKRMLHCGLDDLYDISTARVGGKTMMDALIPAAAAADDAGEELEEVLRASARAAKDGMERTREMVARYGRAKSYGERTIGTPDAGAVSTSLFFDGLLQGYLKQKAEQ